MSELLPDLAPPRRSFGARLRGWFLTGLLVLGPTTITLYIVFRFLWLLDSLLGRYIKIPALTTTWLPEGRVPGLGILAMFALVLVAGALASSLAGTGALAAWERVLTRLPLARIIYSATKSLGEAFFPAAAPRSARSCSSNTAARRLVIGFRRPTGGAVAEGRGASSACSSRTRRTRRAATSASCPRPASSRST